MGRRESVHLSRAAPSQRTEPKAERFRADLFDNPVTLSTMNTITQPASSAATSTLGWAYSETHSTRDLRLDLMRGLVFVLLFAVHFDYFSLVTILAWERVGVVSSAETFVALAGIVVGAVFGQKMRREGFSACIGPMWVRAIDLYKANLIVILTIGAMRYVPGVNTTSVTTFADPYSGQVHALYPDVAEGFVRFVGDALMLQAGPHQFQVMGLYAVLFVLSPLVLLAIDKRKAKFLSAASIALYLYNFLLPEATPGTAQIRLTGAQFEYAFPVVAWQMLYVHAVIAGAYKDEIVEYLSRPSKRWLVWMSGALTVGFAFFSLNHPMDKLPSWATLNLMPADTFMAVYKACFLKYNLGPGRLLNEVVLFISLYAVLTVCWQPINRALGWFFIPLGRHSLYVFIIHVFLVLAVGNTPLGQTEHFWLDTLMHLAMLGLAWWCVKKELLFRWLPH
jgi:hypothetical protein